MTSAEVSAKAGVSVVIPTFERPRLVQQAIDSVRRQTYEFLEVVVVEDGSYSGVKQYIDDLHDARILYYHHLQQRGLSAARNTGVRLASGEYVAFLDDDDAWRPEKIARQLQVIRQYQGRPVIVYCGAGDYTPTKRGPMAPHIYNGALLPQSSLMLSRSAFSRVGGFSEDVVSCVDHDFWMKLARAGFWMDYVEDALVCVTEDRHPRMMSQLTPRIKGVKLFYAKWGPIVRSEVGDEGWMAIESLYYQQTIRSIRRQYLDRTISKRDAIRHVKDLIVMQSNWFVHLLDYLVILLGRAEAMPFHTKHIRRYLRAARDRLLLQG